MAKCSKCGNRIGLLGFNGRDGKKYCMACGKQLNASASGLRKPVPKIAVILYIIAIMASLAGGISVMFPDKSPQTMSFLFVCAGIVVVSMVGGNIAKKYRR
jgi:hypothetical protein